MKKILYIIALSLACILLPSCKNSQNNFYYQSQKQIHTNDFNEEVYVWESFLFPTNRTTGAQ